MPASRLHPAHESHAAKRLWDLGWAIQTARGPGEAGWMLVRDTVII